MEMTLLQKESDQKGDYNMPITSNTINNDPNRSGNMGATAARRTFRTGNSTITLREGETLKGVVSDVHGNEIVFDRAKGRLSYHQPRQWNDLHESHVLHLPSGHGRYD